MLKALVVLSFMFLVTARAEISVQGPQTASGLSFTFTETPTTNVIRGKEVSPGAFFLNSQYGYIDKPLVWSDGTMEKKLVKSLQTLDLRAGLLLRKDLNVSLNLSLNSASLPDKNAHTALGDSTLQFKYRLTSVNNKLQIAMIPELVLPVGSKEDHLSAGTTGLGLKFAFMRSFSGIKIASNIGYRYQPDAVLSTINYEKQILLGLGAEIPVTGRLAANLEAIGFLSTPYNETNSTGELYAGGLYAISPTTVFSAGVSRSGLSGDGNQSYRAIAGFKTYFGETERSVKKVQAAPAPAPAPVVTPVASPFGVTAAAVAPVKECFTEPYTNTFHSRPLTDEEMAGIAGNLPYIANRKAYYKHASLEMKTLKYGEMTGVKGEDFPFVKDSQIPFAIDIVDVPEFKSIKSINHAWLKMRVNKLSQDRYLGTELICSMNFGVCSGATLEEDKWAAVFNPRFFNGKQRVFNDRFSKLYLDQPVKVLNGENLYSKMLTFPLQDLTFGSEVQPRHFFQNTKEGKRTLFFVVADDTFLSNEVSLEVSMGVERCLTRR